MKQKRLRLCLMAATLALGSVVPAQATHVTQSLETPDCTIWIDAEVYQPSKEDIVPIHAGTMQWSEETLTHIFFDDADDIEYYRQSDRPAIVDGNIRNGNIIYDDPDRGSIIVHANGSLNYISPKLAYDDAYLFSEMVYEWPDEAPQLDEAALSAADALRQMAESLGLNPGEILTLRYCDEAFCSEYGLSSANGYLIFMELCLDGVPCYPFMIECALEWPVSGSSILGYVVDNEVIYVSTEQSAGYEMLGPTGESAPLLTFDAAIEALHQWYSNLIMNEDVNILQIRLAYVPVLENNQFYHVEMRPAWCFYTDSQIIPLDAITGRLIR